MTKQEYLAAPQQARDVFVQESVKRILGIMQFIDQTRGRFFSVTFKKRTTGEMRTMICRTGVHKFVTGEGLGYDPREKGLVTVWTHAGYRMVPCENVVSITFQGREVTF